MRQCEVYFVLFIMPDVMTAVCQYKVLYSGSLTIDETV